MENKEQSGNSLIACDRKEPEGQAYRRSVQLTQTLIEATNLNRVR